MNTCKTRLETFKILRVWIPATQDSTVPGVWLLGCAHCRLQMQALENVLNNFEVSNPMLLTCNDYFERLSTSFVGTSVSKDSMLEGSQIS